jgi:hypothetical protein
MRRATFARHYTGQRVTRNKTFFFYFFFLLNIRTSQTVSYPFRINYLYLKSLVLRSDMIRRHSAYPSDFRFFFPLRFLSRLYVLCELVEDSAPLSAKALITHHVIYVHIILCITLYYIRNSNVTV